MLGYSKYSVTQKLHVIQISVFLNFIERQPHPFIWCCLSLLSYYPAELSSCNRDHLAAKTKIFTIWPFTGKVSDPRHGEIMSDVSLEIIETGTQWNNILLRGKRKMNQNSIPSKSIL